MKNLDKAGELIRQEPLPDDAEEQLEAIIAATTDDFERKLISQLWEAVFFIRYSGED